MRTTLLREDDGAASPITREPGLRELLSRAATHGIPLLLLGPEGIGKRWLARSVHRLADCRGRLVVVDSDGSELESSDEEIIERLTEALDLARDGTLVIQDLASLPRSGQAMLATALDGSLTISLRELAVAEPVRTIACLHAGLDESVHRGRIRRDLADRFLPVDVPPLERRASDLPVLIRHALAREAERVGRPEPMVPRATITRLVGHGWPTRMEQIERFAETAVAIGSARAAASMLELQSWPVVADRSESDPFEPEEAACQALRRGESIELEQVRQEVVRRAERRWLLHVLRATDGDRRRAARMLGLDVDALVAKMREHGIPGVGP